MGEKTAPRLTALLWKVAALDSNANLVTYLLCELGCHLPSLMFAYPFNRDRCKAGWASSPVAASGAEAGPCGGGKWGTAGPLPDCSAGAGTRS